VNTSTGPDRHLFPRRVAAVAAIAAAALALSACTPSSSPIQHTTSPHHVVQNTTPTATPTPTPTPTPTVAAVAPPQVRIPLTCAQLASTTQMHTVLGATLSPTKPAADDESTTIDPDLSADIAVQEGALNCSWTSPVASNGNAAATYDMSVIPDATGTWNSEIAKIHQYYSVKNPLGPNTWSACWVQGLPSAGKDENCGFDVLIGSTWLSMGAYTDQYGTIPTEAQAFTRFEPLFQAGIAKIKTITVTEPAWTDPAATPVVFPATGGAVSLSGMSTAVGVPFTFAGDGSGPVNGTNLQTYFDAEALPVKYHGDNGGNIGAKAYSLSDQILPSGAWAYASLDAAAAGKPLYAELSGLGTKAFRYGQSYPDPNTIVIVGIVGENLYTVEASTDGAAGRPVPLTVAKAAAAYIVSQLS
jgi:hypothetical protein